jgi:hypothetical protein
MNKRNDSDLIRNWKITLPATLAGRVEYMLLSPIHQKPIYGARARLVESLLEYWVSLQSGSVPAPLPTLEQLRSIE